MRSAIVFLCAVLLVPAAWAQGVVVTRLEDTLWRISGWGATLHARGPRPTPSEVMEMARGGTPRPWVRGAGGGSNYSIDFQYPGMRTGGSFRSISTGRDSRLSKFGDDCWSIRGFQRVRGPEPTADEIDVFLQGKLPRGWSRTESFGSGGGTGVGAWPDFVYQGFERVHSSGTGSSSSASMLGLASTGTSGGSGTSSGSGMGSYVTYVRSDER